jgi:hypothetical protein
MPSSATWYSTSFGSTPSTISNYVMYNNAISGNSTMTLKSGYILTNPNGIKVTSTNGTCTFNTFGTEVS